MPSTTYVNATLAIASLQDRTDSAGVEIEDVNGEELRLYAHILEPGRFTASAFNVVPGAGLSVDVGDASGSDLAVVPGFDTGQGNYLTRVGGAVPYNIPLQAADLSNSRIDSIYLVVTDNIYDLGGLTLGRLALRTGDAAGTPSAPGADAAWSAYLKLADIVVGAGATSVNPGNITKGVLTRVIDGLVAGTSLQDGTVITSKLADAAVTADKVPPNFFQSFEVDGYAEDSSESLTSSFATIVQVTLTIPVSWGSWKCFASASYGVGATTAGARYETLLRIDGANTQIKANVRVPASAGVTDGAIVGRRAGMTTTGGRVIALQARGPNVGSPEGEALTIADSQLYARAIRTS